MNSFTSRISLGFGYPPCYYEHRSKLLMNLDEVIRESMDSIKRAIGGNLWFPQVAPIIKQIPNAPYRGQYDPISKCIILVNGRSCRKTVIHELIHAASSFSELTELRSVIEENESVKEIVEGLAEFFTGLVLYKEYRRCYEAWVSMEQPLCAISYVSCAKFFGALVRVYIDVNDLKKIFFHEPGRTYKDWREIYQGFLDKYGLEDFINVKSSSKKKGKRKISPMESLRIMVTEAIRKQLGEDAVEELAELLASAPDVALDYAYIIS